MQRLSALLLASAFSLGSLLAQTSDIVVFSEMGEKFTLMIDGDQKNEVPAARVVATGITNATPMLLVKFADATIPPMKQTGWMEPGKEYTVRLSTNKKGERVFRMQGEAPLGTAAATNTEKPKPTNFTDDAKSAPAGSQPFTGGTVSTTTTTTAPGDGMNVNMSVGGVNVHMDANDGTYSSSTTTTTTHTVTGNVAEVAEDPTAPVEDRTVTSASGCSHAMSVSEFADARKSIEGKGFEETKMTLAKQIGRSNCFSTDQVKDIMTLFGFEDSKLDFAKFAYDRTVDTRNYYKVNDAFGFSTSVDELNKYIQGR